MNPASLPIAALGMLGKLALAQADNPQVQLRDCPSVLGAEGLTCLLERTVVPPARPVPVDWIISQTTSPVDYAPISTATISSREHEGGSAMQLSIRCRGGRTELAIAGAGISGRGEDYLISYRVSSGRPEQVAALTAAFGVGVAVKSDPVALLQSLPSEGELAVRLSPRVGTAQDGVFSLSGLDIVRAKMKAACKWPDTVAKPDHGS
jgi:hypothetical protein